MDTDSQDPSRILDETVLLPAYRLNNEPSKVEA